MNERSFQWPHSFNFSSGAGYFKQNIKKFFNVKLILCRLESTEICRIILNLHWYKQLCTDQNLRFLTGSGFFGFISLVTLYLLTDCLLHNYNFMFQLRNFELR